MNTQRFVLPTSLVLAVLLLVSVFVTYRTPVANGAQYPGLAARIATTSNPTVTNSSTLVFATTTSVQCSSRTITTYASPIMITFADVAGNGGPTGTFGHLQPASTTVTYDSGLVGCGALRIYSFTSQAITVSEAQ